MKLFLCGGGAGEQTAQAVAKLNKIIDNSKPILYIPLAMSNDKYDSCYEWINGELNAVDVPAIDMVRSAKELVSKDLDYYSALFIGGGNTFKLLYDLKVSKAFDLIKDYINRGGVVFGGSAGAIIFGKDLDACKLEDPNYVGLDDITGYDVMNGVSILCHYTNGSEEDTRKNTEYLLSISNGRRIIALPEEDTIYIDENNFEVIGTRPYYIFENGEIKQFDV